MKKLKLCITLSISTMFFLTACSVPLNYGVSPESHFMNYDLYSNTGETLDKGPAKGGVLKLFSTCPDTLNPLLSNNSYVNSFSTLVYESLVKLDNKHRPQPVLSDKWDVSEDGLVWKFHIRENVKWHDGEPFTADDVEYTFATLLNSKTSSIYKKKVQNITTFVVTGSNEFRLVLNKPNAFTPQMFTFPILPRHHFSKQGITAAVSDISPIGTGPYKFRAYKPAQQLELIANSEWWGGRDSGEIHLNMPYISEILIKLYKKPDDAITAFQAKEIDMLCIDSIDYEKYTGRSDINIKKFTGNKFEFISFNLKNPILADKTVRKAFSLALDRKVLLREVRGGRAVPADIPVMPGSWYNDSENGTSVCDPASAKALLLSNGWKDIDGTLYKRINGVMKPLKFELLVNDDNEMRLKVAEIVTQQAAAAGFSIKVVPVLWEDEFKKLEGPKFDMAMMGVLTTSVPDMSQLYSQSYLSPLHPSGIPLVTNISAYSNTSVNRYIDLIFNEDDPERRKAYFINMKQIIDDDLPYIGLYFYNNAILFSKRIRGELNPYFWNKLNGMERWYLPEG